MQVKHNKSNMISVGIIGLGKIALGYDLNSQPRQIFSHAKSILKHSKSYLLWGVDPNLSVRKQFEKYSRRPAYSKVRDIPLDVKTDFVIVATPTPYHLDAVKEALLLKPRRILIEKPIARTLVEAKKIVELCHKQRVPFALNYHLRFDPGISHLIKLIRSGDFGKLQAGHVFYGKGVNNCASYYINIFCDLFDLPQEVRCFEVSSREALHGDFDVNFSLKFKDASIYFQAIDHKKHFMAEMDLVFEKGRVCLSDLNEKISIHFVEGDKKFSGYRRLIEKKSIQPKMDRYQYHVLDYLLCRFDDKIFWKREEKLALMTMSVVEKICKQIC